MRFPVFATGMKPVDSAGRSEVVEFGTPIACGGVLVREGDLVVADVDGIIVVPREVEEAAIRLALEKVDGENRMRDAIRNGMTLAEAFDRHGIL
jgi:regulator of RNase E activity RraA